MICTLIRAAEINEQIAGSIGRYLRKPIAAYNNVYLNRIAVASLQLGSLAGIDLDNMEVYTAMVNVMTKIRGKL